MSTLDPLDRAMRGTPKLHPGPEFTLRVMSAVIAEDRFAPIPFPWRRIAAAVAFLFFAIAAGLQ
jgi:hypothetical protein